MTLRNRLLLFSSAQLVVFGLLFVLAYLEFRSAVLPVLRAHIVAKTTTTARALRNELDIPLGAEDATLLNQSVASTVRDPDLRYLEVRDAKQHTVYSHGDPFTGAFDGPEGMLQDNPHTMRAWMTVSIEGLRLGTVVVVFETTRIDRLQAWVNLLVGVIVILWLAAFVFSLAFSRTFVLPIRHMMKFSRKVASGQLGERLEIKASGELRDLTEYLNTMTRELATREQQRLEATARTEAIQRELRTMSRIAGMAEVATGVLHNVGNVLNSVNVSTSLAAEILRTSKVATLERSIELFQRHPGGLPDFLTTEKGKVFPEYIAAVSQRLVEENAALRTELVSVIRNVEHIKTIVAAQQSFAHVTGMRELVELPALLDEALQISETSFSRHRIEVIKDYEQVPAILTDRHRLLQIMINLVSNARHALKNAEKPPLMLTVSLRRTATEVTIGVTDTGVGIPAENLTRIFQHGFTTKPDGHGFGLHSSANAAQELGGRIHGTSEGRDRGATFSVELPIRSDPSRSSADSVSPPQAQLPPED